MLDRAYPQSDILERLACSHKVTLVGLPEQKTETVAMARMRPGLRYVRGTPITRYQVHLKQKNKNIQVKATIRAETAPSQTLELKN